jgi:hypothetical protein
MRCTTFQDGSNWLILVGVCEPRSMPSSVKIGVLGWATHYTTSIGWTVDQWVEPPTIPPALAELWTNGLSHPLYHQHWLNCGPMGWATHYTTSIGWTVDQWVEPPTIPPALAELWTNGWSHRLYHQHWLNCGPMGWATHYTTSIGWTGDQWFSHCWFISISTRLWKLQEF